jgi:hypothetical protein
MPKQETPSAALTDISFQRPSPPYSLGEQLHSRYLDRKAQDDTTPASTSTTSTTIPDLTVLNSKYPNPNTSRAEIKATIFPSHRVRKAYKADKRSRGPDSDPTLITASTPSLPSPTSSTGNPERSHTIDAKPASVIRHKHKERKRRAKHDLWIRALDSWLPDKAFENIEGFSIDGKKAASKEQVLEAEVVHHHYAKMVISQLLGEVEELENERGRLKEELVSLQNDRYHAQPQSWWASVSKSQSAPQLHQQRQCHRMPNSSTPILISQSHPMAYRPSPVPSERQQPSVLEYRRAADRHVRKGVWSCDETGMDGDRTTSPDDEMKYPLGMPDYN